MTRTVAVLKDLGVAEYLSPMIISETERVEKPSISIFLAACARGRVSPVETLHVGDDLKRYAALYLCTTCVFIKMPIQ